MKHQQQVDLTMTSRLKASHDNQHQGPYFGIDLVWISCLVIQNLYFYYGLLSHIELLETYKRLKWTKPSGEIR